MRKLKLYEGLTLNLELSSCETFKLPALIVFSSSTQTILTFIKEVYMLSQITSNAG